jgi:hypothetical protein
MQQCRHTSTVTAVAVGALSDGTPVVVSGGVDDTVRVWRLGDGSRRWRRHCGSRRLSTALLSVATWLSPQRTPISLCINPPLTNLVPDGFAVLIRTATQIVRMIRDDH